jgi:hypothetical protein
MRTQDGTFTTAQPQLPPAQDLPDQELPDQDEPDQLLPDQELPVQLLPDHEEPAQDEPAHEEPAQDEPAQDEPAQELPAQLRPFQVPPDQLLPAVAAAAMAVELNAWPKMSLSPVRTTPLAVRWSVPRAASSEPVPVALVNVWV